MKEGKSERKTGRCYSFGTEYGGRGHMLKDAGYL